MLKKTSVFVSLVLLTLFLMLVQPLSSVFAASAVTFWMDHFQSTLESRWFWFREDPTHWSLTDKLGYLKVTTQQGAGPAAKNVLLQKAPEGDYVIETNLDFTPTADFQMAGLLVYLDDQNYLTLGRGYCSPGPNCVGDGIYFDHVDGGSFTGDNYAYSLTSTSVVWLRIIKTGNTYTGYYSENGWNWTLIGSHTPVFDPDHIGLTAHNGGQPAPEIPAYFEYFSINSRVWQDDFAYTLPDNRWSWVREDGANWSLSTQPGYMRIMTQPGALIGPGGDAENLLLQEVPIGDYVIETHLQFTPLEDFNFAGLLLYLDDDNFLAFGRAYCTPSSNCVGNGIYFDHENNGQLQGSNFAMSTTNLGEAYLKVVKSGSTYTGYYSEDGEAWTLVGSHSAQFKPDQIGLASLASSVSTANIPADFDYFRLTSTVPADLFNTSTLSSDWSWVREDPSNWALSNFPGFMQITTQVGSIFGPGGNSKNILLQPVPLGDYALETFIITESYLTENFQSTGLIVYLDDDNYLKLTRGFCDISGTCIGDGIYFDHESGGAVVGSNFATPTVGAFGEFLKIVKVGNTYSAYLSWDGGNWTYIGSHSPSFTPTHFGLIADQANASSEIDTYFDYFAIDDRTLHQFLPLLMR